MRRYCGLLYPFLRRNSHAVLRLIVGARTIPSDSCDAPTYIIYRIAGNFRGVQIFAFFEGRVVNAKIKTGINSHAPVYAGAKPIGGCGLLALTRKLKPRKFLLRALGAK